MDLVSNYTIGTRDESRLVNTEDHRMIYKTIKIKTNAVAVAVL